MLYEENETTIRWDYFGEEVTFFTTRRGEKNNIVKRLGKDKIKSIKEHEEDGEVNSWTIKIAIENMRNPYYVTKVIS